MLFSGITISPGHRTRASRAEGARQEQTRGRDPGVHGRDGRGDEEGLATSATRERHMSATTAQPTGATAIRPFHVDIHDDALDDLRRRLAATRWPQSELVQDASQGVQLATAERLMLY